MSRIQQHVEQLFVHTRRRTQARCRLALPLLDAHFFLVAFSICSAAQEHVQGVCVSDVNGLCMGGQTQQQRRTLALTAAIQALLVASTRLTD